MTNHLERARLLLAQSRPELAEKELRLAIAKEPNEATTHAVLALCVSELGRYDEATQYAQQAVALGPDEALCHYALANVYDDRNMFPQAFAAINEAIRLDPYDADHFALLSSLHYQKKDWRDALVAAEQGLSVEPENPRCANLRAMALVKLGEKTDAAEGIETALARDPDNSLTHANMGWTLLESGQRDKALQHFRESLRLHPGNEWARAGIVEALKSKNIIYRMMLKYFLWMAKLKAGWAWLFIIGAWVGIRIVRETAESNPELAPYLWPLVYAYVVFVFLTWLARPLFNLLLRLNREGRYALTRENVIESNWCGVLLLAGIGAIAGYFVSGEVTLLMSGAMCGFLLLPLTATFGCDKGWPRTVMFVITLCLGVLAAFAIVLTLFAVTASSRVDVADAALLLFTIVAWGCVFSTWAGSALAGVTPKRNQKP